MLEGARVRFRSKPHSRDDGIAGYPLLDRPMAIEIRPPDTIASWFSSWEATSTELVIVRAAALAAGHAWLLDGQAANTHGLVADDDHRACVKVRLELIYGRSHPRTENLVRTSAMGMYHDGQRSLQDQFDTRRLADRLERVVVRDAIDDGARVFIESRDMFFLASADAEGRPNCSYKGGDPGFVRVVDERTVAFPNYDGNGMFLSLGNVSVNPHVGLLFIDFEGGNRMRLNGTAELLAEDPLLADYPEANGIVRVRVREVFPNCPRYIHRYQKVQRSPFVPTEGCETPVPAWKRSDWARDVLPGGDPATDPSTPVV